MAAFLCLIAVIWGVAAAPAVARTIPDPNQKPAPGNDFYKKDPRFMGYTARTNYMLECAGCHQESGIGYPPHGVPVMTNFVGKFLRVDGGRDFLLQVPGVTQSSLTNGQLADLLNWMLFGEDSIAAGSTPRGAEPFTRDEVAASRHKWINDLPAARKALIEKMQSQGITINDGMNND